MKAKYSMFGILAAMFLVVSLIVPGNLASPSPASADAGVCKWNYIQMPGSQFNNDIATVPVPSPGCDTVYLPTEVQKLVPTANPDVILALVDIPGANMAAPPNICPTQGHIHLYASVMKGTAWTPTAGNHLDAAMRADGLDPCNWDVWDVAAAPDDPLFWAAVTGSDTEDGPVNVYVTTNGGGRWENTGLNVQTVDRYIGAIDVSPAYAGKRDIAVGLRSGFADDDDPLWLVQSGGYAGWTAQDVSTLSVEDTVGFDFDIVALKFSPTYIGDAAIAIVFALDDGIEGTYYNVALRDLSSANEVLDWAFGDSIEVKDPVTTDESPDASDLYAVDLELPSDFSGQSASLRRAYISTDDGGQQEDSTGIFRIDDTTVYTLMDTSNSTYNGKRIHSIAYYGTYASGKLLAGESMGEACTATVPTWFTDSPTVCPVPCWYPCLKCPTGAAANCCGEADGKNEGNAYVIWSKDGTLAYAGTSSLGIVSYDDSIDNWYEQLDDIPVQFDETAISVSRNNGETWNQIGFIDTWIDRFTDVAVTANCTTIYITSNNPNPSCYGFDSMWRTTINPTIASPFPSFLGLGGFYERVLTRPNGLYTKNAIEVCEEHTPFYGDAPCAASYYDPCTEEWVDGPEEPFTCLEYTFCLEEDWCCNEPQSDIGLVRLPPPGPNCDNGMVVGWAAYGTRAQAWSPDYGDYWANITPRNPIQDFAFESPTLLYNLSPLAAVQRMPYTGTAWSTVEEDVDTSLTLGHTIAVQPEGKVIVGGAFSVLFPSAVSLDGGKTFNLTMSSTPTTGNFHVAFDPAFDANKTFYVADDSTVGTVYRVTFPGIGLNMADLDMMAMSNGAAGCNAPHAIGQFGIQLAYTGGALYTAHCGGAVDRNLWPLGGMPKPGLLWDHLPVITYGRYNPGVQFTAEPWSLKICGCCTMDTNTKLWALDFRHYVPFMVTGTWDSPMPDECDECCGGIQGFLWGFEDCLAKKGPALITQNGALIGCDPVTGRASEVNLCWEQLCVANGYDLEIAKDEAFTLRVVDLVSAVSCSYYRPVDVLKPCVFFPAGGSVVNIALTTNLVAAGTMLTDAGGGLHVTTITTYDNVTGEFETITDVSGGFGSYAEGGYGVEQDQNLNIGPAGSAIALAGQLECGHKYFWRIQARNCATGVNLRSQWSEVRSFSVKAGLPIRADTYGIKALAPDNGALGIPVKPVAFSWAPMGETTKYKFVLAKDAAMTQVVAEAEVPTTSYAYNGTLDYSTNYFWRVMAIEPSPTDWSATFAFQTEPAPQPPPAPEEAPGTPMWVWVIIAIGAILVIVTLVLIFKTRRA